MQHLIVILDEAATSFCFYSNKNKVHKFMDMNMLKDVISFAQKEGLLINFLVGNVPLPQEYIDTIDVINHILIAPADYPHDNVNDVIVINYCEDKCLSKIPDNSDKNVILRIGMKQIDNLTDIIKSLFGKFKRLNVSIQDIEKFKDSDFEIYNKELEKLKDIYLSTETGQIEISILTDRIFLDKMNNCNAGTENITVAPNGRFYICPAFYYDDENDSVGDLVNGLNIKNKQLLRLDHAPICRNCDAYQCKRCIWLNRKTTLEVNTPSHEQCVVAHLERNESRDLLAEIRKIGEFMPKKEIKKIDYLDPFDIVNHWK